MVKVYQHIIFVILVLFAIKFCIIQNDNVFQLSDSTKSTSQIYPDTLLVKAHVLVEKYFQYIDSIVIKHDSLTPYNLTEHLLVRANSWIIDTLQNTDYYRMISRDSFVYNQKKMIVLPKGSLIIIPDSIRAKKLSNLIQNTIIDINIPEFKLRIYEDTILRYKFPVRVGRNEKKYLEMSGRIQDLKTKVGEGYIVNHVRNPRYVNPVNNHQYFVTKRDDDKVTKLPQIPFIETEINGIRNGQLIHPTTNPITLEKAYSNGCIGTKEADAWVIYYYAPKNTKVKIRYDLTLVDDLGNSIVLEDIYHYNKKKKP